MNHNIYSALHYKNTSEYWIQKRLGVVGLRIWHELRGKSCLLLDEITQPRKAIMSSRSFGRYVTSLSELEEAVSQYTTRAAEKVRLQKTIASSINVFIQTNHHKITDMQHAEAKTITLAEPTAYTPVLIDYALFLLRQIYKQGFNYIKAGVLLEGLVPESSVQLSAFESNDHVKQHSAMKAMDSVNTLWGRDTMRMASSGVKQQWKMKMSFRSRRYTTNWNELMTVKI
jgi:DNA polymerase V